MRLALKIAFLAAGKSQREVGAECGIPENRLSDIVQGWREPRRDERAKLAAALHCPEERLFQPPSSKAVIERLPHSLLNNSEGHGV